MALLITFMISWLLIACAIAWSVGKAAEVGDPVQEPAPPAPPRLKRSYSRRKLPGKVVGPPMRRRASPLNRIPSGAASRSVH